METFNSMAPPAAGDGLGLTVNGPGPALDIDGFGADLTFDDSLLDNVPLSGLPFTTNGLDFDAFPNFDVEDPFAFPSRPNFPSTPDIPITAAGSAAAAVTAGPRLGHGHGERHDHHARRSRHHSAGAAGSSAGAGGEADADFADQESSPQDEESEMLRCFSAPLASGKATLVDDQNHFVEPKMTAELLGMFFVAEDVFGAETNPGSRPQELTCYRRNLWQCSGQIILPRRGLSHILTEMGVQVPFLELAASITAIESIEGKATEIISIPWKSANPVSAPTPGAAGSGSGAGMGSEDHHRTATAPPRITLDLAAAGAQDMDGDSSLRGEISLPVSWKRLQFKHATANNGRRKGLQQHYVVQINLLARTQPGTAGGAGGSGSGGTGAGAAADDYIKIAEIRSGPVIVRGRSPRNFDSRKDVPLSSSSTTAAPPASAAASSGDKKSDRRGTASSVSSEGPVKADAMIKGDPSPNPNRYPPTLGNIHQPNEWPQSYNNNGGQHASKKVALSPTLSRPPVPAWVAAASSDLKQPPTPTRGGSINPLQRTISSASASSATLPINLSLSEDERSPPTTRDLLSSPQFGRTMSSESVGLNPVTGSPLESADLLYEYFPLSLDDWVAPVDAIYRPHVVHHTVVPPEVQAQNVRSKAKRYFTAD